MNNPAYISLLQNAAWLLALVVVFDLATSRQRLAGRPLRQIVVGLILGGICMALIQNSFRLESGIVFDTRSVLLSISGLFFGTLPTLVGMAIAAAFRLAKGGVGAWTGVAVTLATGAIGIAWRRLRRGRLPDVSARELYFFGIVVHVAMLALMLTLPREAALRVLRGIGLPVILVYPLVAAALGLLLANRLRRDQAANALQASEHQFRTFVENAPDAIFIQTQGRFAYLNPAAVKLFGAANEHQLLGTPVAERFRPEYRPVIAERIRRLNVDRQPVTQAVHHVLRCDGAAVDAEFSGVPFEYYGENGALVFVRDVSERNKADRALRESEEKFAAAFHASPNLMAITRLADGSIVDVNESYSRMLGYSHEESIARTTAALSIWANPADRDIFAARLRESGQITDFETTLRRKDGSKFVVLDSARLITLRGELCILSVAFDISERKKAAEALRESEERFRTLVDSAPEGIFVQADGRFLFVNPAMARMLGAEKPEALVGADTMPLMAPEYREAIRQRIRLQLETGAAAPPMEQEYLRLDGGRVPVETTAVPVRFAGRDAHLVFVRDVADRKHTEAERQKLQSQLAQAQKMDSIGRLAGGVAHDFNNMLSVILGHAELALDQMDPAQPAVADLREIQKAAERSADLTRQLLAFARKQTVVPKELDLNETVEGMLKMLRRLIGENVDLAWHPARKPVRIKMDPSQLDQILANLCVNARDAVGEAGKVTIETNTAEFDDAYCAAHPGYVPGEYAALAVSDDGCGMDSETLARLFEPFFTTKESGKGTGLGLATVYGIVKQNRGFIHVYSEPGQGTTLQIHLPLQTAAGEQKPQTEPAAPLPRGRETILLVEDEPGILSMTRMMLELCGYHVLTAATPGEAFRQAEAFPGEIHLLMTDVVMPEMNGRELARQLLAHQPRLKRLFMSGYPADVIAPHGVLEQGVHFIQKPFSAKDLAAKVREALGDPGGKAPA